MTSCMNKLSWIFLPNLDRRRWELDQLGCFSVFPIPFHIDDFRLPSAVLVTRWNKHIPIKVNIFSGGVLDRILTKKNLNHQ